LIDPRSERSFVQRANAIGLRYALTQRIEGYNISIGRQVNLRCSGRRRCHDVDEATDRTRVGPAPRRGQHRRRIDTPGWTGADSSRQRWLWPWRKLAIAVGLAIVTFLLIMSVFDAPAITGARTLPRWVIDFFDWVTDFGKSGYFLWPLGLLFIGLAALPPVSASSQRVLAAVMVRSASCLPRSRCRELRPTALIRHWRARPFVGGAADPFLYAPFTGTAAYASMPSGHATTALSVLVALGILWPRARTVLLIYALLICVSRVVVTAHTPATCWAAR